MERVLLPSVLVLCLLGYLPVSYAGTLICSGTKVCVQMLNQQLQAEQQTKPECSDYFEDKMNDLNDGLQDQKLKGSQGGSALLDFVAYKLKQEDVCRDTFVQQVSALNNVDPEGDDDSEEPLYADPVQEPAASPEVPRPGKTKTCIFSPPPGKEYCFGVMVERKADADSSERLSYKSKPKDPRYVAQNSKGKPRPGDDRYGPPPNRPRTLPLPRTTTPRPNHKPAPPKRPNKYPYGYAI